MIATETQRHRENKQKAADSRQGKEMNHLYRRDRDQNCRPAGRGLLLPAFCFLRVSGPPWLIQI